MTVSIAGVGRVKGACLSCSGASEPNNTKTIAILEAPTANVGASGTSKVMVCQAIHLWPATCAVFPVIRSLLLSTLTTSTVDLRIHAWPQAASSIAQRLRTYAVQITAAMSLARFSDTRQKSLLRLSDLLSGSFRCETACDVAVYSSGGQHLTIKCCYRGVPTAKHPHH